MKQKHQQKRTLKEPVVQPLSNVWHMAVSKDPDEKQDGRDGLSLLFLLFEDTLELKANHDGDPLEDLDKLLRKGTPKFVTLEECARPRRVLMTKSLAVIPDQVPGATDGARANAP